MLLLVGLMYLKSCTRPLVGTATNVWIGRGGGVHRATFWVGRVVGFFDLRTKWSFFHEGVGGGGRVNIESAL